MSGIGTSKGTRSLTLPSPSMRKHGRLHTSSELSIVADGKPEPMTVQTDKPSYRVPLMAEIAALPWNGYNAVPPVMMYHIATAVRDGILSKVL